MDRLNNGIDKNKYVDFDFLKDSIAKFGSDKCSKTPIKEIQVELLFLMAA